MKTNHPLLRVSVLGILALILCSFTVLPIQDTKKIEGIVYDEFKKPLAGVDVFNITNGSAAISGKDGAFRIRAKSCDVIRFSYPEKLTKEVTITNAKKLKVYFDDKAKLEADAKKKADKEAKKNERIARKNADKIKKSDISEVNNKKITTPFKNSIVGQVLDQEGMPIPGLNVIIRGTRTGTQTDFDGNYGIDAKENDVLVFSYIGMRSVEVIVGKSKYVNVTMKDDAVMLDSVVVEGYRTTTRATSSVSVTTVSSESIEAGSTFKEGAAFSADKRKETAKASPVKSADAAGGTKQRAGQLTAGEVNDFSKWAYWEDIAKNDLEAWQKVWQISPSVRYSVVLTNSQGYPVVNRTVLLKNASNAIFWTARTDNTGRAELWYKPEEAVDIKSIEPLMITDANNIIIAKRAKEFHEGANTFTYKEKCSSLNKVNIAFMVDATGSMGDEISYLQAELNDVIERSKAALPEINLTMGSVFYRDHRDEYLLKNFDFTDQIPDVVSFIQKQHAAGGGDTPEAAVEAYEAAIDNMDWDDDARTKLLFVILDAPPHENPENIEKLHQLARSAAAKGIRIIPIAASGIDKSTEYLMRAMALETNGTYLFITNHSGIGNDHIEPSTDSYKVEMLNDLILRVILQFTAVNDCDEKEELQVNTKIEEQLTEGTAVKWSYFPNPTSGPVTVQADSEATELFVYDTTGKLIVYNNTKSTNYNIDLSGQPNAVYYIKVMVNGQPLFGKIIKKS